MNRLNGGWRLVVITLTVVAVAAVAGLAIQVYAPHTVPKVLALVNGPITHDELGDGHGTSHYSKVTYTKITNPFRATVTNVRIGGRHPDNGFCWNKEKWKSK